MRIQIRYIGSLLYLHMREIEELIGIIAAYKAGDVDIFNELSTDELRMCVDHYDAYQYPSASSLPTGVFVFTFRWRVPFIMEINRRKIEERDNKLNELGI